ncbi:hypothetical protein ACFWIA_10735 [Streptomyces sp. NPDC127068]|uniref:hypothetical protein n=1 Tax=Streptomyces sp. NPDC127068 TaxID=3347127 RepID=UPI003650C240
MTLKSKHQLDGRAGWLLGAAEDASHALGEWASQDIALLGCGLIFSAVRVPGELVHAAARTDDEQEIAAFLQRSLDGGPVIRDRYARQYYVLVPVGAELRKTARPGRLEHLGRDCYLGVPKVECTTSDGRAYWCVPMTSPGRLCSMTRLRELINDGEKRLQAEAEDACPSLSGGRPEKPGGRA